MITTWNAKFLMERARDALEAQAQEQSERDYAICVDAVQRALSDSVGGYRSCALNACRRARRCVSDGVLCLEGRRRPVLPPAQEGEVIDEVYWDMQARRLLAEEG